MFKGGKPVRCRSRCIFHPGSCDSLDGELVSAVASVFPSWVVSNITFWASVKGVSVGWVRVERKTNENPVLTSSWLKARWYLDDEQIAAM